MTTKMKTTISKRVEIERVKFPTAKARKALERFPGVRYAICTKSGIVKAVREYRDDALDLAGTTTGYLYDAADGSTYGVMIWSPVVPPEFNEVS